MELKAYIRLFVKWIWLVLLLPLLAGCLSAYVSFFILKPVYESNTTLYVNNSSNRQDMPVDYSGLLASDYLVKDYRELVKSRTVAQTVIEELALKNVTIDSLASSISVNSKNETRIIEISVRNGDPKAARDIADCTGVVFMQKVKELMKVENVSIVDKAEIPVAPVAPSPLKNTAIAIFVGLAVAVGIILVIDYFDDAIKTPEDIDKYVGIPVLGNIPVANVKYT